MVRVIKVTVKATSSKRTYANMASGPITSCDCNHEIKTLAPWKKSYDKSAVFSFSHVQLFAIP